MGSVLTSALGTVLVQVPPQNLVLTKSALILIRFDSGLKMKFVLGTEV